MNEPLTAFALRFKGYWVGCWNDRETAEFMKSRYKKADADAMEIVELWNESKHNDNVLLALLKAARTYVAFTAESPERAGSERVAAKSLLSFIDSATSAESGEAATAMQEKLDRLRRESDGENVEAAAARNLAGDAIAENARLRLALKRYGKDPDECLGPHGACVSHMAYDELKEQVQEAGWTWDEEAEKWRVPQ